PGRSLGVTAAGQTGSRRRAAVAALTTRTIMLTVLAALVPGLATLCYYYGPGYLPRLAFAGLLGLAGGAAAVALQGRPVRPAVSDGSTLVTCTLLTLALPPGVGLAVLAVAVIAAVGLGKHV